MISLLEKLTQAFGVSGNEEQVRDLICNEIKDYVDSYHVDALGNLIAVKKGSGRKIMLAAHMDEIGIMATHIDDKGFIRFTNIGGISPHIFVGQKVRFANGTCGAIFYEEKDADMKNLKFSKMYIDIGASSRAEAEKKVKTGDTACFLSNLTVQGEFAYSKAMDDRCGCAVLVELIRNLSQTSNELYFVFTVQEEVGLRGARTAAFQIVPDIAIAVDITRTGDTPEAELMEVQCGKGPAVKIKDSNIIAHPEVKRLLADCAGKNNIPFQYEVLERGGTDAGAIHITAGGIPSGALSIPCRYIHSPVECISLRDLENAVKILREAVKQA